MGANPCNQAEDEISWMTFTVKSTSFCAEFRSYITANKTKRADRIIFNVKFRFHCSIYYFSLKQPVFVFLSIFFSHISETVLAIWNANITVTSGVEKNCPNKKKRRKEIQFQPQHWKKKCWREKPPIKMMKWKASIWNDSFDKPKHWR